MKKKIIFILLILILIYTRLAGLNWGLPYPMHPDERNIADALQQLNCKEFQISNCFNPHFFAYGQFSLYLGYLIVLVLKFFDGDLGTVISFQEAVIALRIISSVASILNVFVILKITDLILRSIRSKLKFLNINSTFNFQFLIINFLILTFSPYFIQFSHFGTTESLLMLFYSLVIYFSLKIINDKTLNFKSLNFNSFFLGLAVATKVSSLIFLAVPLLAIIINTNKKIIKLLPYTIYCLSSTIFIALLFSPHNLINSKDFISSLRYESNVALGRYSVFYTRQFVGSIPIVFQMTKIFPYALGWPQFLLAFLGFFLLSWRNKLINFLRFSFFIYFLPTSLIFAKWTRFMAPIFPVLSIFVLLLLLKLNRRFFILSLSLIICLPGIIYLLIYFQPDIRFQASEWIYKNIPENSKILSETANVIDIPIPSNTNHLTSNYQMSSFNFYDLDTNPELQNQLKTLIQQADYILIPSRRLIKNHPKKQYPILNKYYDDLMSGKLGFEQVAEFKSPKACLFNRCLSLDDEEAEETWTVFDRPVIRIFKKNSDQIWNPKSEAPNNFQIINFQNYRLLVADTPDKLEYGLMNVKNKNDINGADGMIFFLPVKQTAIFWNKNTYLDLDVYWLNDDKIIGQSFLPSIEKSRDILTITSPKDTNKVVEIIK